MQPSSNTGTLKCNTVVNPPLAMEAGEYHQIETGKWWIKQDINDSMKVLWILSYKSTIEAPVILPYNTK